MSESASVADVASILADYIPLEEYNATLDALNAAIEERDAARADHEKGAGRLKELEGKVRSRAYRDAYDRVRKDARIKDEFADDVFRLLDLPQDADEPDEKAIKAALETFTKDRKHYLDVAEKPRTIPAGEGAGRGRPAPPSDPEFRVTYRQLNDVNWVRENQGRMLDAKRAGTLVIDEDD